MRVCNGMISASWFLNYTYSDKKKNMHLPKQWNIDTINKVHIFPESFGSLTLNQYSMFVWNNWKCVLYHFYCEQYIFSLLRNETLLSTLYQCITNAYIKKDFPDQNNWPFSIFYIMYINIFIEITYLCKFKNLEHKYKHNNSCTKT